MRGGLDRVEIVPIDWSPAMSICASEPFLKLGSDEYGWLGGIGRNGKVRCLLPYTIVRKAILRLARFRVETIPLCKDFSVEDERSFLNMAMAFFEAHGVDLIIPASTNALFRTYPDGAVAAHYGSYVVDLAQDQGELWKKVRSSHRRQIKSAGDQGVDVRFEGVDPKGVHGLVKETFQRSRLPFMNFVSFEKMLETLEDNVRVFGAYKNGELQACAVFPFSNSIAYYMYGGTVAKPATGAMHVLHWEAMRWFAQKGVGKYDFVGVRIEPEKGSKQAGLATFKSRFGGNLERGFIWKYPINKFKFYLYGKIVLLQRGGDIVDQEKHKL